MMGGKLFGGILAVFLAAWLVLPHARRLEDEDREKGVIGADEYAVTDS